MSQRILIATFADEKDLLQAVGAARQQGRPIIEVYTPYAVHGLDRALDWPRSRLAVACFFCGLLGVAGALGFQFWASGWNWPLNVGGQPWNSLPAFVPVTFETMVLFAGVGLFLAWLLRCRLYPGKKALVPSPQVSDNRFVMVVEQSDSVADAAELQRLLQTYRSVDLEERDV